MQTNLVREGGFESWNQNLGRYSCVSKDSTPKNKKNFCLLLALQSYE